MFEKDNLKVLKKVSKHLNPLQVAQLVDCINDGRTVKVVAPKKVKKPTTAPLFESNAGDEAPGLFDPEPEGHPSGHFMCQQDP